MDRTSDQTRSLFQGFAMEAFDFLMELSMHDSDRAWFTEHREIYEREIKAPMKRLAEELEDFLNGGVSRELVRGTVSRIYRDARFTHNRSLYKHTSFLIFKPLLLPREAAWYHAPCYFFEIKPDCYTMGCGAYSPRTRDLARTRRFIAEHPEEFEAALRPVLENPALEVAGERYKKKYQEVGGTAGEWYGRRSPYVLGTWDLSPRAFERGLAEDIREVFQLLKPLNDFLWELLWQEEEGRD